jgi:hypothetical protein
MELKSQIHGTDISHYSKPFKIVFTLADQLLNQGYIISLDNHYICPDLFNLLSQIHTTAVGNIRSNRKGPPEDVINCKLKKGGVAVSYRNQLMVFKWKEREMYACSSVYMMMMCASRNVDRNKSLMCALIISCNGRS